MSARLVGTLSAVHRYPVKSMAGEPLAAARVLADRGVEGDRVRAVLDDETGRIASAKHPRRWGALLGCAARLDGAAVAIALPDGTTTHSDAADVDRVLSRALGRAVRLTDVPPPQATHDELGPDDRDRGSPLAVGAAAGTFFDFAPIHLVTTATLARLAALRPTSRFAVARFRPNLVIDTADAHGFVEDDWLGQVVAIGDEVELCVTFPCPRCVMTTLPQADLPADPDVLRTAADHHRRLFALLARSLPTVGAYASVLRGGTVRPGDRVRLTGGAPLRRAAAFVRAVKRAVRR